MLLLSEITTDLLGCIYGCNIVKGKVRDEIKKTILTMCLSL